jgi:hypothetical protein
MNRRRLAMLLAVVIVLICVIAVTLLRMAQVA